MRDEMAGNAVADLRAMEAMAALLRIDCLTTVCLRLYRKVGEADYARAEADDDDGHRDDVVPVAVGHADVADEEEVCLLDTFSYVYSSGANVPAYLYAARQIGWLL